MPLDYAFYEYYLSAGLLVLAMLGMGTTLTAREFVNVLRAPHAILVVLLLQLLITPLVALGLAKAMWLPPGIAVGMLVVAAMPGGSFSNVFTYLGRGNVALSISATAVSTLGCLVTTAFVLKLFGAAQLPDDFQMPAGRIVTEITCCLLLPLLAGMWVRRFLPEYRETMGKVCVRTSVVLLAVIIVAALGSGRVQVFAYGLRAPVAMFLFGGVSLWLSYGLAALCRFSINDSFTIAIEVVVRNAHLGLLLKAALFPAVAGVSDPLADGVLYTVLVYGALSLVIASSEVIGKRNNLGFMFGRGAKPPPQQEMKSEQAAEIDDRSAPERTEEVLEQHR
jgi:BASS family bile acid:Na+ symporter